MKKRYIQTCLLILGVHDNFFASYKIINPIKNLNPSILSMNSNSSQDRRSEDIIIPKETPIQKTIIDADFIKIVMKYYKMIQSWQTSYWYLPGFKAYDMQNLVTAMNNDINTYTISSDQLHFILDVLIQQIRDIEINNVIRIIKAKFQSLSTTKGTQLLKKIHETVFKITNPNDQISFEEYQSLAGKITPIVGKIETTTEYIKKLTGTDSNNIKEQTEKEQTEKKIIERNLKDFIGVINSRGDGNCGYRSFIISTWFNNPKFAYNYFKQLLKDKFEELFEQYDETFTYQIKSNKTVITKEILSYLLSILEQMKDATSQEQLISLLNNETTFDYFMIMFIRYLVANYIIHHATAQQIEFINILNNTDSSTNKLTDILSWKKELDDLETSLLAHATSIKIHTIQQNAESNSQVDTELQSIVGHAYILFTDNPGHYQILLKNMTKITPIYNINTTYKI